MYKAMKEAIKQRHDYYLMINDDVMFYDDAVDTMVSTYIRIGCLCGITGTTYSNKTRACTYGGMMLDSEQIISSGICDLANWNCFMVNQKVIDSIGIISNKYSHGRGYFDYSLRMKRNDIPIYITPKYVGECESHIMKWQDKGLSRKERLNSFFSPKGMHLQ